jgi:hypothetical protein
MMVRAEGLQMVVKTRRHNQSYLISKDINSNCPYNNTHAYDIIIMPVSPLAKSSSPFQLSCVLLNPCGRRHHYEKQILFCIHGKSILLLGHLGAFCRRIEEA